VPRWDKSSSLRILAWWALEGHLLSHQATMYTAGLLRGSKAIAMYPRAPYLWMEN
jgi:hypothetical protein